MADGLKLLTSAEGLIVAVSFLAGRNRLFQQRRFLRRLFGSPVEDYNETGEDEEEEEKEGMTRYL